MTLDQLVHLPLRELQQLERLMRGSFPLPGEVSHADVLRALDAATITARTPPQAIYARVDSCTHCGEDHGMLRGELLEVIENDQGHPEQRYRQFHYGTFCPAKPARLTLTVRFSLYEQERGGFQRWKETEARRLRELDDYPPLRWQRTPPAKRPRPRPRRTEEMTDREYLEQQLENISPANSPREFELLTRPQEPRVLIPHAPRLEARRTKKLPAIVTCACGKPGRLVYTRQVKYQPDLRQLLHGYTLRYKSPHYVCTGGHTFATQASNAETRRMAHNQFVRRSPFRDRIHFIDQLRHLFHEFYPELLPPDRGQIQRILVR